MSHTFLFPGQGSQKVGMAADLYEKSELAKQMFDQANSILGRSITDIMFKGPEELLKSTDNTQPAIFVMEAVLCDLLKNKGIKPSFAAGHSLGEYGALYAAGVFSFADGVKLVAKRGELMAKARSGGMAAIMGLPLETIKATIATATGGVVVTANENAPDQTVISGDVAAVKDACAKLTAAGAKRAIELPVSGAFHSPLMQEAADAFAVFLAGVTLNNAEFPVFCNVTAAPETDGAKIKDLLVKQLVSPVRWVDSMAALAAKEVGTGVEVGPGAVLKGLVKKCQPQINVLSCETFEQLSAVQ